MSLHPSQRQEPAVAAAPLLTVVRDEKSVQSTDSFQLHAVPAPVKYTTASKSYNPRRRYTIDDNGGSYEGL